MLRRCGPPLLGLLLVTALAACGGGDGEGAPATSAAAETRPLDPKKVVSLVDESWVCRGRVDLDLVKVEIRSLDRDAVYLREDCTGRIGRLEVDTWVGDGVKVNAPAPAAHDLVVEGGYIRCHDHGPGAHQDGVQAMGGERITFRELEINCNSEPNAQFYVSAIPGGMPTEVVCERCFLGPGAASTFFVDESVRSGARETLICPGRFHTVRVDDALADDLVFEDNQILPADDSRCTG